ncbi:DUF1853 family protein [Motiliproteus coralliicola]|uniref:DUF1853 family protein n=1 Tax=Motiliproteus coralliicola TaxID=2283196 RepID=A0A369WUG0_9GAMM|nr:DUF1853 family protein [Motiliproteus coralliicola]RDE24699.1 DUF1853 family protein [Motiliproteus coralliicola]
MHASGYQGPSLFGATPRQRHTPIARLNHPGVRDLAWTLISPALFQPGTTPSPLNPSAAALDAWLWRLQQQPAPLELALAQQRSHRLGVYFETLIDFFLRHFLALEECHYGLPVRAAGHTYGEYDFLLRPRGESALLHLELSLKFYLGIDDRHGQRHWLGLNRNDVLQHKYNKLVDQQLNLSQHPVARNQLKALGSQVGPKVGLIKGRLFYPLSEFAPEDGHKQQLKSPSGINRQHLRGWWQPISAWQELTHTETGTRLVPLQRRQWMAVLHQDEAQQLASQTDIEGFRNQLQLAQQPLMCARLQLGKQGWRERDRGVLVPDPWLASVFETFDQT